MKTSSFIVAHNFNGYSYIREVSNNSTTVYADVELGYFSTLEDAEKFAASIDAELEADWLDQLA